MVLLEKFPQIMQKKSRRLGEREVAEQFRGSIDVKVATTTASYGKVKTFSVFTITIKSKAIRLPAG